MDFASYIKSKLGFRNASSTEKRVFQKMQHGIIPQNDSKVADYGTYAQAIAAELGPKIEELHKTRTESSTISSFPKELLSTMTIFGLGNSLISPTLNPRIKDGLEFALTTTSNLLRTIIRHLEKQGRLTKEKFSQLSNNGLSMIQSIASLPIGTVLESFMHQLSKGKFSTEAIPKGDFLNSTQSFQKEHLHFNDSNNSINIKPISIKRFIHDYKNALKMNAKFRQRYSEEKQNPVIGCPAKFISVSIDGHKVNLIEALYKLCCKKVYKALFESTPMPAWYDDLAAEQVRLMSLKTVA